MQAAAAMLSYMHLLATEGRTKDVWRVASTACDILTGVQDFPCLSPPCLYSLGGASTAPIGLCIDVGRDIDIPSHLRAM